MHGKCYNSTVSTFHNVIYDNPKVDKIFYCFNYNVSKKKKKDLKFNKYLWLHRSALRSVWYYMWTKPCIKIAYECWKHQYVNSYITFLLRVGEEYDEDELNDLFTAVLPSYTWCRTILLRFYTYYLNANKYRMYALISQFPFNEFGWDWTWWPEKLKIFCKITEELKKVCKVKASCGYLICGLGFVVSCIPLFGHSESNLQISKLLVPPIVRNWIYCKQYVGIDYLFCTDSVKKQWYIKYTFIRFFIKYIQKFFKSSIVFENLKFNAGGAIDVGKSIFVVKFNGHLYKITSITICLALDPAHWGRRIYGVLSKRNPLTWIHKKNVNFVFRSASIRCITFNVSKYKFGISWFAEMKRFLNHSNVCILKALVVCFMAQQFIHYTRFNKNTTEAAKTMHYKKVNQIRKQLRYNLVRNPQWFSYLVAVIKWIVCAVPKCMQFFALSVFRPNVSWKEWCQQTCRYQVIYRGEYKTVLVPAFSISYYFYKCLVQNIAASKQPLIWRHSYQDVRQLQIDALAIFEFGFFFICFFHLIFSFVFFIDFVIAVLIGIDLFMHILHNHIVGHCLENITKHVKLNGRW